jgi:patatin-related protein
MREKELRIALVCFGGVSLAVYMHGITKEVLKLVRASAALHAIDDRATRARSHFFDSANAQDQEYDTEDVYYDLLREIGTKVELRVIVDIIAGASAGGINGTMLARALSHDLPINPLRDLWLDNADVTVLLAPDARASAWSKWFLQPFIWLLAKYGMAVNDKEVAKKLSLFFRSRWFKPPLDGKVMDNLMYDAAIALGAPKRSQASLLPSGHGLDLFVTLTDYHGYYEQVPIHDPPAIYEVQHHQILHFRYRRWANGKVDSDFDLGNAPALAFAARATSSFPGAFPPARIVDIDDLVARRRAAWPQRQAFIAENFRRHQMAGVDPATASFIDGSVLNNRPFREAIAAIHLRSAFRQVDRRLVYIDPVPRPSNAVVANDIPNFFSTLWGAASDIPRAQPVTDELNFVAGFNDLVTRIGIVIERARPHISDLVARAISAPLDRPVAEDELREWRERINTQAMRDAGFAYEGYVRLKLSSARNFVTRLIVKLREIPEQSPLAHAIAAVIDVWASSRGFDYDPKSGRAPLPESAATEPLARWANFLLAFDVKYRERRLNFLIEGQNRLYELLDGDDYRGLDPQLVDQLKGALYVRLDDLRSRQTVPAVDASTRELAKKIFATPPSAAELKGLDLYAHKFVARHGAQIDVLIDQLENAVDLHGTTHDLDVLFASLDPAHWHHGARREVMVNYLGFPFWDVLTFPMMTTRESGEFKQILIDRISPQDVRVLKDFAGLASVKGSGFGQFAAFFSRAYRENDYLLGRLHALERLIDIVCDCADVRHDGIDMLALKKRGFLRILAAEEPYLPGSGALIKALRDRIGEVG